MFVCWVIEQIGTQWSDGTDGVTQCATMPGDTFTYKFVVDRVNDQLHNPLKHNLNLEFSSISEV